MAEPVRYADTSAPAMRMRSARRWARQSTIALASVLLSVCASIAIFEALGWPFLAGPIEQWVAHTLDRRVSFGSDAATSMPSVPASAPHTGIPVRIHLIGSLRVDANHIEIGAPSWSAEPYMLSARDAHLKLSYADLWRAHRGEPLRIRELRAAEIDSRIERRADGRASWQLGQKTAEPAPPFRAPAFDLLRIGAGRMTFRDELLGTDLAARFSLTDGGDAHRDDRTASFRFDADGHYRKRPMKIEFASNGVLDVVTDQAQQIAWPVRLTASVGNAGLSFRGTATDPLRLTELRGVFDVHGPSLAAVGDPLGVTLPTTGAFRANGALAKSGNRWSAVVERARVGSSDLNGAFVFDAGPRVPLLSGRLRGTRLLLADLGPAVGTAPKGSESKPAQAATAPTSTPAPSASAPTSAASASRTGRRTLPDRPFDLPSLRAMNANVLVDIDDLDLGSSIVEPLRPLRTHLVLNDGVLTLSDIDARTAQGSLTGELRLDGRTAQALWNADLRWRDVQLERWLHQTRKSGDSPPFVTGKLNGTAQVTGQGASTAAILGSLRGNVRMQMIDASVSHLMVEAAGLDLAQALGVMVKGDDAMPVQCGVADLAADKGVLRPKVFVLDTRDSTIWVEGGLSLADETLDLRLLVSPKDFSPLALRTPVRVRGDFADPSVSIEKRPLMGRVGAAALLALVNPIAAVLPFFDTGNNADAQRGERSCRELSARLSR